MQQQKNPQAVKNITKNIIHFSRIPYPLLSTLFVLLIILLGICYPTAGHPPPLVYPLSSHPPFHKQNILFAFFNPFLTNETIVANEALLANEETLENEATRAN